MNSTSSNAAVAASTPTPPPSQVFTQNHMAMILKYSGISFISGAVNHGFFSGTRSVVTALIGIVLFVLGAWMEHRNSANPQVARQNLIKTLLIGTLLSIGLGFFTGGLQHFPDSPARSSWVVPLGYVLSWVALVWTMELAFSAKIWRYGIISSVLIAALSWGSYQFFIKNPQVVAGFGHDHGAHGHGAEPADATVEADAHAGHADHAMGEGSASGLDGAKDSTQAYNAINAKMHQDMNIAFTGDADVDFLAGMVPHHQGAVEMAQVVLKHGKDERVKKLAADIIAAQEREIALMKGWLEELDHSKHQH